MNIIQIKILEDRTVETENIFGGITGENDVTQLKFIMPEDYKEFYKYLDIIKSDGIKTQTVVGDNESYIFYYNIPYSLTDGSQLYFQLVAKKENKVFKSNAFTVYFNGSINATQILECDFQDTIEYLMENKTDNTETQILSKKLNDKVDKSEFQALYLQTKTELNNKISNEEFLKFQSEIIAETDAKLNDKVGIITVPISDNGEDVSLEDILKNINQPGVYFINHHRWADPDLKNRTEIISYMLTNEKGESDYTHIVTYPNGERKRKYYWFNSDGTYCEDSEPWEIICTAYTQGEKTKLFLLPNEVYSKASIDIKLGKIDEALDELHNYAQALVNGGV